MGKIPVWNPAIEFIEREALEQLQLARLRQTVEWALKTPFYHQRLTEAGLTRPEDIASLRDVRNIPYTTKDDPVSYTHLDVYKRQISCSRVTRMRQPDPPMGWPSAMAPPLTLTLLGSQPISRLTEIA